MLKDQGVSVQEILSLLREGREAAAASSPDNLNMTKKKLKEILFKKRHQRPEVKIVPDNEEFWGK